jgi:hypothetical protein
MINNPAEIREVVIGLNNTTLLSIYHKLAFSTYMPQMGDKFNNSKALWVKALEREIKDRKLYYREKK